MSAYLTAGFDIDALRFELFYPSNPEHDVIAHASGLFRRERRQVSAPCLIAFLDSAGNGIAELGTDFCNFLRRVSVVGFHAHMLAENRARLQFPVNI